MPTSLLHAIFFLSGLAGLGCQLAWTRMLTVGLGHEMPSVLAVVAAFFGGLALGGWLLAERVAKSERPGRFYAILEAVIGVWALATVALIPFINQFTPRLIGIDPSPAWHWLIAFTVPLIVLLPATTAMGATLPAMERALAPLMPGGRSIGALYAANTFGGLAGVWLSAFVLAPAIGHSASVMVFAAVNLLCAAAALLLRPPRPPVGWATPTRVHLALTAVVGGAHPTQAVVGGVHPTQAHRTPPEKGRGEGRTKTGSHAADEGSAVDPKTDSPHPNPLPKGEGMRSGTFLALLFFTGLLGVGFESLAVRGLAQVLTGTVYSYALALAVFLTGTALGAAIYQRIGSRLPFARLLVWLLALIPAACLLGAAQLAQAAGATGGPVAGRFEWELVTAARVLLLPSVFMGATFSHLLEDAKRHGIPIGRAVAVNTLGAAVGPALFAVALVSMFGVLAAMIVVSLLYLIVAAPIHVKTKPRGSDHVALLLPLVMLLPLYGASLRPHVEGVGVGAGRIISYEEGVMASVAVIESEAGRVLQVNNRFNMGSTAKAAVAIQRCQGHIPLLLHPAPKSALFLGPATGITLGAATHYEGLSITGVELLPEVIDAMKYFEPHNRGPFDGKTVTLHAADARRFIRATINNYDVIVADLFHPAADGTAFLYTVEHFATVRDRLNEGGLFCQWLPLYQLDEATLKIIVRSFLEVFPEARAFMADFDVDLPALALIGGRSAQRYPLPWYERRLRNDRTALEAIRKDELRLEDDLRLFGRWVAGPDLLFKRFADAPRNTDDQPRVLYGAPRATSAGRQVGAELLLALVGNDHHLIDGLDAQPSAESKQYLARLTAFIDARNAFLHGLLHARADRQSEAIERYIESARLSPDFTLGYAHAITFALHAARDNPALARSILERLEKAQPQRPAARQMLERLFPRR